MASKDILSKFDELMKLIAEEKARMKEEIEAYNIEKEKMKAVTVSQNDVVHLNVGGQKMSTTRSTLCQVKGSLLASMFSGRWEDNLERDKDGHIFLDFDPDSFVSILSYLRSKKIETPENPAHLPEVAPNQVKNFNNLVEYLGLGKQLAVKPKESFKQHSDGISVYEETTAVHSGNDGHQYVLGENSYNEGIINWKFKIESFKNNHWMFVGVVSNDRTTLSTGTGNNNSYGWPGSYGWALGNTGQTHTNGQYTSNNSHKNLTKQGDIVELTLNCKTSTLTLLTGGQSFYHTLPTSTTWCLNVNLNGAYDKITII